MKKEAVIDLTKLERILLRIFMILFVVFIILFGLMLISYCKNGFNWGKASILGYRIYYVPTESMEPVIHKDSFILSKRIEAADVKIGDIIVYEKSPCYYIVHRVKKIEGEIFTFQGDNNTNEDPSVNANQIIGKIIWVS